MNNFAGSFAKGSFDIGLTDSIVDQAMRQVFSDKGLLIPTLTVHDERAFNLLLYTETLAASHGLLQGRP